MCWPSQKGAFHRRHSRENVGPSSCERAICSLNPGANPMSTLSNLLARGSVLAAALLLAPGSQAGERVIVGVTGTPNALAWPFYIAMDKQFFAAEDIEIERVFAPSSAAMML